MKKAIFVVCILLFPGIIRTSFAQKKNYQHIQLTINEGLANNSIECLYKDSEGYVWIGTQYGLNRYDGFEIKTYRKTFSDTNSISSNRITSIVEDEEGYIWIGTNNGLNRFNKDTDSFHRFYSSDNYESIPDDQIISLKYINGKIWLGTNEGLAFYNDKDNSFRRIIPRRSDTSFRSLTIYDILETKAGEIFISSENNCLHKLDPNTLKLIPVYYSRSPNFSGNYRKHMIEDALGNIWISALNHGLAKYNYTTKQSEILTPENSTLQTNLLNGKLNISGNKLWLTTDGYGIIIFDIEKRVFYSVQNEIENTDIILNNKVYSILFDEHNIIWLGSFIDGVSILDPNPQKFSTLQAKNTDKGALRGKSVLGIFEDSNNNIWIGTDGDGLYKYDTSGNLTQLLRNPNNQNSLSSDRIVCISEDNSGNILLGAYTGGFMKLNPETNQVTRFQNGAPNQVVSSAHVWAIYRESAEKVWLGLLGNGVDLFNPELNTFHYLGPASTDKISVNHPNINSIIQDSDGDIWFATEGAGINYLDSETQQMFYSLPAPNSNKLEEKVVRVIFQDTEGVIWFATEDGGLYHYDKYTGNFDHLPLKTGNESNMVLSIVEDANKNLWLGTGNGVIQFNIVTKKYIHYTTEDGLQGNMCNRNSILRSENGTILIGTTNGISSIDPDNILINQFVPNAILTKLRIQNKTIQINDTVNGRIVLSKTLSASGELILKPRDKTFSIEFAAINHTLPHRGEFKYRLAGFEEEWNVTDANRRYATYTNLDPGKYTFIVAASNSDGIWSNNETELHITVLPTFWHTIWFKGILFIILFLLFLSIYKYLLAEREKQYKREKEADERKIVHLEKEKLEAELNNQTFNVIGRNKTLVALRRRLSILSKRVDNKNQETLKDIIDQIDKELSEEKDWKHIEPRLDKVYNNFMTTLKQRHTDLTLSELRITAYVRMGLSTKEISELMQKTTKAVENDRYRLRKKLEISSNSSLKKYLLDLS